MESSNLETAAKYVNNLLLARGLLKNGKPIKFMHSEDDDGESTWARIINLINDLVVRRDVGAIWPLLYAAEADHHSEKRSIGKTSRLRFRDCELRSLSRQRKLYVVHTRPSSIVAPKSLTMACVGKTQVEKCRIIASPGVG